MRNTCVWLKLSRLCAQSQEHCTQTPCHSGTSRPFPSSVRYLHRPGNFLRRCRLESCATSSWGGPFGHLTDPNPRTERSHGSSSAGTLNGTLRSLLWIASKQCAWTNTLWARGDPQHENHSQQRQLHLHPELAHPFRWSKEIWEHIPWIHRVDESCYAVSKRVTKL